MRLFLRFLLGTILYKGGTIVSLLLGASPASAWGSRKKRSQGGPGVVVGNPTGSNAAIGRV